MKKIILLFLILLELFTLKIPDYVELNDLAIIEKIYVEEKNNQYTLILKEIIPLKSDQGISYKYEYHKSTANSLDKAYIKIKNKTKKKLYLNKVKSLITNIKYASKILKELDIKPKTITHTTKDISTYIKQ